MIERTIYLAAIFSYISLPPFSNIKILLSLSCFHFAIPSPSCQQVDTFLSRAILQGDAAEACQAINELNFLTKLFISEIFSKFAVEREEPNEIAKDIHS